MDKTLHGTLSFASTPTLTYTGSLKFADTTTLLIPSALPNTDANGVSLSWSYGASGYQSDGTTAKAGVCHLANNTPGHSDFGKVKGGASAAVGDKCKIFFTASSTNYISTEYPTTLVVGKADQPTSPGGWSNPYGANQVLVGETLALDTTNSTPPTGQGPLRYKLTYFDSNANHSCTLNGNTGAVTGSRVSNNNQACAVEARLCWQQQLPRLSLEHYCSHYGSQKRPTRPDGDGFLGQHPLRQCDFPPSRPQWECRSQLELD